MESMSPALAGGFITTAPPGKSHNSSIVMCVDKVNSLNTLIIRLKYSDHREQQLMRKYFLHLDFSKLNYIQRKHGFGLVVPMLR